MRRLFFALFVLLLGGNCPAGAEEAPRTLIERAIKAMGGAELLQQKRAVRKKIKGKYYNESGGQAIPTEGESWGFGRRTKLLLHADFFGNKREVTLVCNGEETWHSVNGQLQNVGKDSPNVARTLRHVNRVTDLVPLLKDKEFTLAPLDDIEVGGRPAAGLKVSCKGQTDVSLYFAKDTGLLVKYAYRADRIGGRKDVLHEIELSDYGVPDLASADEKLLREAKSAATGPALLEFLRARTPRPATVERVRTLIRKLGDDAFKVRERASAELVSVGAVALTRTARSRVVLASVCGRSAKRATRRR